MGFKEVLQKMKEKREEKRTIFNQLQNQDQLTTLLSERKLSSNERELNRYLKENREEDIKKQLDILRKRRRDDIAFNHNPINAKNITNNVKWKILKERNLFSNKGNIFNGKNIFKAVEKRRNL